MLRSLSLALLFTLVCLALCESTKDSGDIEARSSLKMPDGTVFWETFQSDRHWEETWTLSSNEKYNDHVTVEEKHASTVFPGDLSLTLHDAARHYGIAAPFTAPIAVATGDDPFVVSFEVRSDAAFTCGGAYVKLLTTAESTPAALKDLSEGSEYSIMFGPDKCGSENKVHFIVKYENEISHEIIERHLISRPQMVLDSDSHWYQLRVYRNNSFAIFIDNEEMSSGPLAEEFSPSFQEDERILDENDFKPSDWVDEEEMDDPTSTQPEDWPVDEPEFVTDEDAVKPDDWLEDEPLHINDPEAAMPQDWDEEEDGIWEPSQILNPKCNDVSGCGTWTAPLKRNPLYKGPWIPARIPNPAYKGPWVQATIPNPNYYVVSDIVSHFQEMGAIAIEIWTMDGGIQFDNIYVGHAAEEEMDKVYAVLGEPRQKEEARVREERREAEIAANTPGFLANAVQQILLAIQPYLGEYWPIVQQVLEQQLWVVLLAITIPVATIFFMCCCSSSSASAQADARRSADITKEEEAVISEETLASDNVEKKNSQVKQRRKPRKD